MTDEAKVEAFTPFADLGAVLEIARLPMPPEGAASAVVEAMRIFGARYDARLARFHPEGLPQNVFRIALDLDVDSGRRVLEGHDLSVDALLGPGYDVDEDRIQLFTYRGASRTSTIQEGLAYALLNPPYGLRAPRAKWGRGASYGPNEQAWMRTTLRAFCRDVLDLPDPRHTEHLRFLAWPTDWSTYFDAGKDWWGSFCWSVEHLERASITVIAASATD